MRFLLILTILLLIQLCYSAENSTSTTPVKSGLNNENTRLLLKAHAILMIIGWLLFVPTGFLFARLGRDLYKDKKLFGSPVWFKVHQVANFLAVGCICLSILLVFVAEDFQWKGTGSSARYWHQWHTDLGEISTVLAVAQPINSYFRCGPAHSNRVYFNWAHRIIGIIGYTLAFITTIIAALVFRLIWNEPVLQVVLISIPTVLSTMLTVGFSILKSDKSETEKAVELKAIKDNSMLPSKIPQPRDPIQPHILRVPAIFLAIGAFTASALALSLLVANGFKNF